MLISFTLFTHLIKGENEISETNEKKNERKEGTNFIRKFMNSRSRILDDSGLALDLRLNELGMA